MGDGNESEDLKGDEVERRKDNMRNPNLVYRNSNDLILKEGSDSSMREKSRERMKDEK